jgi:hypothetical protein
MLSSRKLSPRAATEAGGPGHARSGTRDGQAREFAVAFRGFLDWIHSPAAGAGEDNEVSALLRARLGGYLSACVAPLIMEGCLDRPAQPSY